jgi:hypothetical protein
MAAGGGRIALGGGFAAGGILLASFAHVFHPSAYMPVSGGAFASSSTAGGTGRGRGGVGVRSRKSRGVPADGGEGAVSSAAADAS